MPEIKERKVHISLLKKPVLLIREPEKVEQYVTPPDKILKRTHH